MPSIERVKVSLSVPFRFYIVSRDCDLRKHMISLKARISQFKSVTALIARRWNPYCSSSIVCCESRWNGYYQIVPPRYRCQNYIFYLLWSIRCHDSLIYNETPYWNTYYVHIYVGRILWIDVFITPGSHETHDLFALNANTKLHIHATSYWDESVSLIIPSPSIRERLGSEPLSWVDITLNNFLVVPENVI